MIQRSTVDDVVARFASSLSSVICLHNGDPALASHADYHASYLSITGYAIILFTRIPYGRCQDSAYCTTNVPQGNADFPLAGKYCSLQLEANPYSREIELLEGKQSISESYST